MAKSRFNIKGTKDFLVAAVILGVFFVWAVCDAWFPRKDVLKRHPQEFPVAFKVHGVVKDIPVKPGQEVAGKTVLATIYDDAYRAKITEAEAAFEVAKTAKDPLVQEKLDVLMKAREDLKACTIECTDITRSTSHGDEPLRGIVTRIVAKPATSVQSGETVLVVEPTDTFYMFNKTLALLTFIGMIAALIFHGIASR